MVHIHKGREEWRISFKNKVFVGEPAARERVLEFFSLRIGMRVPIRARRARIFFLRLSSTGVKGQRYRVRA